MAMKTLIEQAQVLKGMKKDGVTPYFYVEVLEKVRKYINPDKPQDSATLMALADSGQIVDELVLHQRSNQLIFSSIDLKD